MTPAAAILARAEAAGVLLRLDPDGQVQMEGPAPPPGLLADIRRYWDAVRSVLKARRDMGVAPPPGWLSGIAAAIRDALAAGAEPVADHDGWFYLAPPDGGPQITVAPGVGAARHPGRRERMLTLTPRRRPAWTPAARRRPAG
jgi:hypothetical protein